ncbi:hypothetical protein OIU77_016876 [Salix suchowensis]|uniref:Uncharacterized protein n=1 Tax=Salix suchowensis TaxID=1278906 RepID=A0ABQ8ZM86_9ROSI|nr:hypothetical protein OIU77_016876 [Salix suchowensis]
MCGGPEQSAKSSSTSTRYTVGATQITKDMNSLTIETEDTFSSLLEFAANNDAEGFKRFIQRDASSINEAGFLVWPPKRVEADCSRPKNSSYGSINVVDVVKLLLSAGADPSCLDVNGDRPGDVVVVPPKLQSMKAALEDLLSKTDSNGSAVEHDFNGSAGVSNLRVSISNSNFSSPTLSSSPENGSPPSPSVLIYSPRAAKFNNMPGSCTPEKREYPIDPSLPDIKNSIYATDEFRMFSFKVPVGVGTSVNMHMGFSSAGFTLLNTGLGFAKMAQAATDKSAFLPTLPEELRPLYVSTGSAIPSPRSAQSAASVMDMAAALSLLPGSPSSVSAMSPTPFNQPMSPSANGISHSSMAWPQPNVPTLHLPGSNLQSSRLRSSFSARDIPPDNYNLLSDFDSQQILNDLTCFSQPQNNSVSFSRSGWSKTLNPSNLDEMFTAEMSSPRFAADQAAAVFSPTHKSAYLNQLQQQQSMLSPINTSVFSPKNVEHHLMQAAFGAGSPGRMSPRSMEPISPRGPRLSALAQREMQQHQQLRSLSSRDLGSNNPVAHNVGSPVNSWSKWGSPNGKLDWSVNGEELGRLRRSSSFELGNNGEEPDLSWVQSLVKESPPEVLKEKFAIPVPGAAPSPDVAVGLSSNSQINPVLESWLEQMQIDKKQQPVV